MKQPMEASMELIYDALIVAAFLAAICFLGFLEIRFPHLLDSINHLQSQVLLGRLKQLLLRFLGACLRGCRNWLDDVPGYILYPTIVLVLMGLGLAVAAFAYPWDEQASFKDGVSLADQVVAGEVTPDVDKGPGLDWDMFRRALDFWHETSERNREYQFPIRNH